MKTYAVVRSETSDRINGKLKIEGNTVIEFPAMTAAEPFDTAIFSGLDNFDWIFFPDAFAALYLAEALLRQGFDLADLDLLRIAILTGKTADTVTAVSIHADLIVESLHELIPAIVDYEGNSAARILVPCAMKQAEYLAGSFTGNEASVEAMVVYSGAESTITDLPKMKSLLLGGAIDEFLLYSLTDLETLSNLLGVVEIVPVLREMTLSAASPHIADQLRRMGLEASIIR